MKQSAATMTTPLTAVLVSSADRNSNQQTTGVRRNMGEERHNNQPQKGGGVSVVRTAATTTTVGMVPLPTTDCGATTADDGSNRGGSRDHGKAKTAPRLRRGERYCQHYDVDKMTREQTLALASAPAAIACYPLPKRVAPREFRQLRRGGGQQPRSCWQSFSVDVAWWCAFQSL